MTTRKRKEGSADPQGDEFVTLTVGPFRDLKVPRAVHWAAVERGYLVTRDWLNVQEDGSVKKAGEPGWNTKTNTDDHREGVLTRAARNSPDDLWAVRTGSVSGGLVVLDFDKKPGGLATLDRLGLGPTLNTPSGGAHVWVSAPGRQLASQGYGPTFPGMEVKAEGSYKATFHGVVKGKPYTFTSWPPRVVQYNDLPLSLRTYLEEAPMPEPSAGGGIPEDFTSPDEEWIRAKLAQAIAKVEAGEGRNDTGRWFMERLWHQLLTKEQAQPWAEQYQEAVDRPGDRYGLGEITDTLNSVWRRDPDTRSPESYSNRTVRVTDLPAPLPLPAGYRIPAGYQVGSTIERMNVKSEFVELAPAPVFITERAVNGQGEETLRLAWWRAGEWREEWFERADVLTGTKLAALAQYGLPLTSGTGNMMARYLLDLEAVNLDQLPTQRFTRQLGWLSEAHEDFYYGHGRPDVVFKVDGARHSSLDAFRTAGSADVWRNAINRLEGYPAAALGVWASFAAVLLGPLGVPSFVLSFSGLTTTGKTTALKLGGSVWGNAYPDDGGLTVYWDTTKVAIEQLAGARRGLPLLLDETKRVDRPKTVSEIIYEVCSGQGRLRGARQGGLRESLGWSTILVSTGEQPITAFTTDGGTRARVVEQWGSPFGEGQKALVDSLLGVIEQNYGHAGPQWIQYVLAHRDAWPKWQASVDSAAGKLAAGLGDVAGRRARYVALLRLAAGLAHKAGLVGWHPTDEFWLGLAGGEGEGDDQMATAFLLAHGHALANLSKFWTSQPNETLTERREPHGGWLGRWSGKPTHDVWWFPERLAGFLTEKGYEPEACRRAWADRGWIAKDKGGQTSLNKRFGWDGAQKRMVVMHVAAVNELQAEADDDPFA